MKKELHPLDIKSVEIYVLTKEAAAISVLQWLCRYARITFLQIHQVFQR
ncbi:MAG: hypothetical protein NTX22_07195 [Ignavibacteriales bacterium]|nr:hypothetical protein [Ignavibacteriales bacterium]